MSRYGVFGCSVSVAARLQEIKGFNVAQLRAALKAPHLQNTVRDAVERRLDRALEHHHNKKRKGRKS